MDIHWLAVLYTWALLAQFSRAFPEEELPDKPEIGEPKLEAPDEEVKDREKRQSVCKDTSSYCSQWPDTYCNTYKDYMKDNCAKKCGYCSGPTEPPPVCKDNHENCPQWEKYGFCKKTSQYFGYMKGNCANSCGFCGGGGGGGGGGGDGGGSCSVSGASTKVKSCTFDKDTCDWHNVPFDDDMDFVIRSSSNSGGPSSGSGGSGSFLETERGNGKSQLLIPFELVLAKHDSDHGNMCIRFNYYMKRGTLTLLSIQNKKDPRKTTITKVSGGQGSSWMCKKATVQVSFHWQLMFEADTSGGPIALDDISFTDGACS